MRNQPVRILEPQLESPAGLCANATNIVVACQFGHSRVVMPAVTPDRWRRVRRPPAGKWAHLSPFPPPAGRPGSILLPLKAGGDVLGAPIFQVRFVADYGLRSDSSVVPSN